MVRKEGLEPSRCYPQVPETCASTSSATFARREMVAVEFASVKEPVGTGSGWSVRGRPPTPPLRVYQFRHFRRDPSNSERGRKGQAKLR
jgi:hypothetical protein